MSAPKTFIKLLHELPLLLIAYALQYRFNLLKCTALELIHAVMPAVKSE